jgi:hypothetical protein
MRTRPGDFDARGTGYGYLRFIAGPQRNYLDFTGNLGRINGSLSCAGARLKDASGNRVTLDQLRKNVVLVFYLGRVRAFCEAAARYGSKKGGGTLSIQWCWR